jgi:hypothetical protein
MRRARIRSLSVGVLAVCGVLPLGVPSVLAQTARTAPAFTYYSPAPASVPARAPASVAPSQYYQSAPANTRTLIGYYYAAPANTSRPSEFYYYSPSAPTPRSAVARNNSAPASPPPIRSGSFNFMRGASPRTPSSSPPASHTYAYKS